MYILMYKEINIIWWGNMWYEIAKKLNKNNINVNLVTRHPSILVHSKTSWINIVDYNYEVKKGIPCIVTVSCNERKIVKNLEKKGYKDIDRNYVAKKNYEIINNIIPYLESIKASNYFVLTNPVEKIMKYIINNSKIYWNKIFWLWLNLDSSRFMYVIKILTWKNIKHLISEWTHSNPFPVLNKDEFNWIYCINDIIKNLENMHYYKYNISNLDIKKEINNYIISNYWEIDKSKKLSYNEILHLFNITVKILIRSEFIDWKPPVVHPSTSVTETIINFLNNKYINVSYIERWRIKWGNIKI